MALARFDIGNMRMITVSRFKGRTRADFRQFKANAKGDPYPTKEGISLKADQFFAMKAALPKVEMAIQQAKETLCAIQSRYARR